MKPFSGTGHFRRYHAYYFAALILMLFLLLRLLSGFNGLYGQDSHEYYRYALRWKEFLSGGAHPGDYFWPMHYPVYGALMMFLIPGTALAQQFISMLSMALLLLYTARLIRRYSPRVDMGTVYGYLFLVGFLSPFLFQSAFLVMSDMLAAFLATAAIYHLLKHREEQGREDLLWGVFFCISAVNTRYPAAMVLLVPAVLAASTFFRHFRWRQLLYALLILFVCLLPHLYIRGSGSGDFLAHDGLLTWSPLNGFMRSFVTADGKASYLMPNLLYSFSNWFYPGFICIGALLLLWMQKRDLRPAGYALLFPLLLYSVLLAGIPYQNMRYQLLTFPLVLVLLFPAFQRLREKYLKARTVMLLAATGLILIQGGLIYKYSQRIYQSNQMEQQVARALRAYPGRPLYTFWIDGALRSYGVTNPVTNLWQERLTTLAPEALVLFNEPQFREQWADKNPMVNWRYIQNHYSLVQIDSLAGGWKLYEERGAKSE